MDPAQLQAAFLRTARRLTVAAVSIDLADLQGDILRAYGNAYAHTAYLFFRIDDAGARPRLAAGPAPARDDRRAVARRQAADDAQPRVHRRRAQGARRARRRARHLLARVPRRDGRARRDARRRRRRATPPTGSPSCSAPATARAGHGQRARRRRARARDHAPAQRRRERRRRRRGLRAARPQLLAGLARALRLRRRLRPAGDRRAATTRPTAPGGGVPEAKGAWRALAPGEFILGYEDEDTRVDPERALPSAPADPFGRTGTYMVCRKLHQDVALFRRVLREAAALYHGGDDELLAAKVVGRWPRRHAAGRSPPTPRSRTSTPRPRAPTTSATPRRPGRPALPARRAHPPRQPARRARRSTGKLSFRHRIIRRGMPYGPPLAAEATEDDGTSTAAWSSSASTRASRASSRASRRSGSTTATSSASATTATSSGRPERDAAR